MNKKERLADEVRALESLDLRGLREQWLLRVGPPPKTRSTDLLRHLLAWRMQARVLGSLGAETRRMLRRSPSGPKLHEGSRVAREWRGARHEVQVVDGGYVYAGVCYESLSEIARLITGTRWNGPRFFGLRRGAPK